LRKHISSTSTFTDKKGKKRARVDYYDAEGKRRSKQSEPARNKTHLKDLERELVLQITNELEQVQAQPGVQGIPYSQIAKEYRAEKIVQPIFRNGRKVAGMKGFRVASGALKYSERYFGDKDINSITKVDIERFKLHEIQTPVIIKNRAGKISCERERSIGTVHGALRMLRSCLSYAFSRELLVKHPSLLFKGVIVADQETKRNRLLSFEEEQRLLTACGYGKSHLIPIIICALDTGHRKGAILKLRWEDVDFAQNTIHFKKEHSKSETGVISRMTPRLREALLKWSSPSLVQPWTRVRQTRERLPHNLVFGYVSINTAFASACKRAGIEDLRFHDLKARFISDMVYSGVGLEQTIKLTGNKTGRIVIDHYVRTDAERTAEAFRKLEAYREAQIIPPVPTIEVEGLVN
jgi:integrase